MAGTTIDYLGIILLALIGTVAVFNIATVVGGMLAAAVLFVTKIICGLALPVLAIFIAWSVYEIFIK